MFAAAESATRSAAAAGLLAFVLLCGCTDNESHVQNAQRKSAIAAIQRLQEAFNRADCQSIYDETDDGFRRYEPQADWLTTCEEIRRTWGRWNTFGATYWYKPDDHTLAVEGDAAFGAGKLVVQVVWIFERGRMQMTQMFLNSGGERISIPSLPFPLRLDPPRKRNRIPA